MKNRPADIRDTAKLVADDERLGLGIAISCGALDDNKFKGVCNTTCKEFLSGVSRPSYRLIGEIKRLKAIVCKNGRKMAFLVLDDNTIELESVTVFPDEFERFEHLLYEGGIVYIEGTKDRNRGGLIVKKVHPA
jgi:DNA polymerase III alpha subunit